MAKLLQSRDGKKCYVFECPGCDFEHLYDERWTFNGDFENPTFSPSLLNSWDFRGERPHKRCHLFVKNGQIEYCSDSTHSLAGKTVPMVDRDWSDYGFGDKDEC